MKVLLVNGYASASHERYISFKQHILSVLRTVEKLDVTGITLVEKHRSDLNDFIFELHSDNADPEAITQFDRLDFVFLDGDCTVPPWHPGMKKVCILVKMCMMTGKCLFGATFSATLLGYLCSTGGDMIHAINNNGRGAPLKSLDSVPPPNEDLLPHEVLLDSDTGDYYTYNPIASTWEPKGNTGLVVHSSDRDHDYGARPNSARAGTRKRGGKLDSMYLSRLADIKCCGRLELRNHDYLKSLSHRQFITNCPSKWDLDEQITSTSGNKYTVFVDSQRGPLLIEFGNSLCAHFIISKEYPETISIMRNYVLSKFEQIKLHEHVDRSYMASVSGMIPDGNKVSKHLSSFNADGTKSPAVFDVTTTGKTSPKKCRPLSAATTKQRPHSATATMVSKRSPNNQRAKSPAKDDDNNNATSPQSDDIEFVPPKHGPIKVCRLDNDQKPYCAYQRFHKMRVDEEKAKAQGYYSVVNDAPYVGTFEKRIVESEKNKLRWMGGPFRTVFGKASTHIHPEEGILGAKFPYNVKHIPANILEPQRTSEHPKHLKSSRNNSKKR